ncbi:hypothetical protein EST38_g10902 [Candolleomyces aberdarensis]|uniref:Uncharacterized protein n=1 Tax=Candolleomyces aberdarensis TaxID=2316362 RepID=A0A4V1Q2G0_9AGAR|nr:hypothetical protein EST38_g10902 [Candolleomyces aberdarensis]
MTLNGAPVTTFLEAARNFVEHVWQQILSNFYPLEDVPEPPSPPSPPSSESLRVSFALPKGFLEEIERHPGIYDDLDFVRLIFILLVVFLVVLSLSAIRRSRARLSPAPPSVYLAHDLTGKIIRAVENGRFSDDVYLGIIHHLQAYRKLIKALEVNGKPTSNLTELGPEHDPVTPARHTSTSTRQRRASPSPTRQRRAESPAPTRDRQRRRGAESPFPTRQRRASLSATQQRRASGDYPEADGDVQVRQNHVLSGEDEDGDRHEHALAPSTQQRHAPRDYPDNVQHHHVVRAEDEHGVRHTYDRGR